MLQVLRSTVCVLALLFLPATVFAQAGPWKVVFGASPDHSTVAQGVNLVVGYELVLKPSTGPDLPPLDLKKPVPVSGDITVDIDTYVKGLPPGTYTGVVRTVGPGGQAVSPASAPFSLVVPAPRPTTAPAFSRS